MRKVKYENIRLNVGCGMDNPAGWVGMDRRVVPGVDIVHDIEDLPWPLRDNSCMTVLMSHVMEHLDPRKMIDIFDEIWRVLVPGGQLMVAVPYAGSTGAYQDPTHTRPGFNEQTFEYFDPSKHLYSIYQPRPYKIVLMDYKVGDYVNVVLESLKKADVGKVTKITGKRRVRVAA